MEKKKMITIGLIAWGVFTIGYIVNDQVKDFKNNYSQKVYVQGQVDTINTLIEKASECKPFSVFSGEKEVNLIGVDCLQKDQAQTQGGGGQVQTPQE